MIVVGDTKPAIWDINLANRDTKFAKAARRMAVPVSARCQGGRRYITLGPGRFVGLREGVRQLARLYPIQAAGRANCLENAALFVT